MARGRLLKTKVKEAREIAKAEVIGAERGKMQVDKLKFNSNNIGLEIKKRLVNLDPSTSTKLIATVGVMFAIKSGIDWTQVQLTRLTTHGIYGFLPDLFADLILGEDQDQQEVTLGDEVTEWLVSFGLAYLIVDNFGEIVTAVGTGLGSILGIAKTMLGAGLIPV